MKSPYATKRQHARQKALSEKGFVQRVAPNSERRIKFMHRLAIIDS